MMWLLVTRQPRPDAPYWPGRRWLAAVDAVLWPTLWAAMVWLAPEPTGVVLPFATAVAAICAIGRLRRAVWENHRYQFSTARWTGVAGLLLTIGVLMKVIVMHQ